MTHHRHRAVVFDLDGVLTDTSEFHYLGWQRLADEEGIPFDRAANEALRGLSRRDSLLRMLGDREVGEDALREMMERKNRYYRDSLEELTPEDTLPGAVALVLDAKARGLKVAIGSSSKNAPMVLDRLGIADLFEAVADGNTVERAKPAPDLFLAAARLLDVEPADCVVVEDAESGVDAAVAAGMTAVGIGPETRVGHAQHRFERTEDVDLDEVVAADAVQVHGGPRLVDGWLVEDHRHDPDRIERIATSHPTGNGYLGYRGTLPEWGADATVGCIVAGTWDRADGTWTEPCTVPNALFARWEVGGHPVAVPTDRELDGPERLRRRLELRYGRQQRAFVPGHGPVGELVDERFASMAERHLVAQRQRVTAVPGSRLTLVTGIDGHVWSLHGDHLGTIHPRADDDTLALRVTTRQRGLPIAVAHAVTVAGADVVGAHVEQEDRTLLRVLDLEVGEEGGVVVEQMMAVHTGDDVDDPMDASRELARRASAAGYDVALARHARVWDRWWARLDVAVDGDRLAATLLRYALYQQVIAAPHHDERLPLAARGLTSQARQGAATWRQEVASLPLWVHTHPPLARSLLAYRHHTLDGARRKAARLGHAGAFYASSSGATGDELCPPSVVTDVLTGRPLRTYLHERQVHVSPDVALAVDGYVRATGDRRFLAERGAEILFEVARFVVSAARQRPGGGPCHLLRVVGPDAYHDDVDDDVFTVEQSRAALTSALRAHEHLVRDDPDALDRVRRGIGLADDEPDLWREVRNRLRTVGPDPDTGVIEPFVGHGRLEDVTPDVLRRRQRHLEEWWGRPVGVAADTRVLRQPAVVQLLAVQPDLHGPEVAAACLDAELARTDHGSAASRLTFALVAARLGRVDDAYELFLRGAAVDLLGDVRTVVGGTYVGGVHLGACGLAWQVAVLGFGGVRIHDDHLEVAPRLPAGWTRLAFALTVRGCRVAVEARPDGVALSAAGDNPAALEVDADGRRVPLGPGDAVDTAADVTAG